MNKSNDPSNTTYKFGFPQDDKKEYSYTEQFRFALSHLKENSLQQVLTTKPNPINKRASKKSNSKPNLTKKMNIKINTHAVISNEIFFQLYDYEVNRHYFEPIHSIKDFSLVFAYINSLGDASKKFFCRQIKAYYGLAYSRKHLHLFLDKHQPSLTDQLWDHKVKAKNFKNILDRKSTALDACGSCAFTSGNNSDFSVSDSLNLSSTKRKNQFSLQNGVLSSNFSNPDMLKSFNSSSSIDFIKSNKKIKPTADCLDSNQNYTDINSLDLVSVLYNNDFLSDENTFNSNQSAKNTKLLNYLSNKYIVKPTIPNSLPLSVSSNLRMFQSLVKNFKGPPISVVNIIDDVPPPFDFEFINESRYAVDVPRPQQLMVKPCVCETVILSANDNFNLFNESNRASNSLSNPINENKHYTTSSIFSGHSKESFKKIISLGCKPSLSKNGETTHMCTHDPDTGCPYNSSGLLQLPEKNAIYECNWMCMCGPKCYNRLIQRGPQISLQIFRTLKKGWGVRTIQTLQRGQFVAEYVGEIITYAEAERRGKQNDKLGSTYLFDLDFETPEDVNPEFTIDAEKCGNITHFFNHSCNPNLQIRAAYINHCDSRLHQLAFFTKDRIPAGTELTFDYNPSAPFPGDKGYININETSTPGVGFSSFRSPNRSSRPGPVVNTSTPNKTIGSPNSDQRSSGESSGFDCSSSVQPPNDLINQSNNFKNEQELFNSHTVTPKKNNTLAPYIHKGYKCYCGAPRCRGFVFLS
ncbi:hypothetical protein BB561_002861 [Smittium simulii]|uniref:Histone-lysine N-methyltransferase n=1 Tax=Smittium simulii TaxID=133385 RepID=A0A2T9YNY8_9FUNG|nr:hypothetical protein BB561_002861 [Smittium simulii]